MTHSPQDWSNPLAKGTSKFLCTLLSTLTINVTFASGATLNRRWILYNTYILYIQYIYYIVYSVA